MAYSLDAEIIRLEKTIDRLAGELDDEKRKDMYDPTMCAEMRYLITSTTEQLTLLQGLKEDQEGWLCNQS